MILEKNKKAGESLSLKPEGACEESLPFTETGRILLPESHIYQGSLILVSQKYPVRFHLPEKRLGSVFPGQPELKMELESAGMLRELLWEIQGNQQKIVGVSGYRTGEEQTAIFQDSLRENGREFTEKYVAFPEHSEHQTGLAMDLAENRRDIDFIRPEFPYHGICRKFRERAADFGFIERYTKEKQKVTGIGTEPWHFRYVGSPHAALILEKGMALEEYTQWLKQFSWPDSVLSINRKGTVIRIGYVKAQGALTEVKLPEELYHESSVLGKRRKNLKVSGNNVDGFVITVISGQEGV